MPLKQSQPSSCFLFTFLSRPNWALVTRWNVTFGSENTCCPVSRTLETWFWAEHNESQWCYSDLVCSEPKPQIGHCPLNMRFITGYLVGGCRLVKDVALQLEFADEHTVVIIAVSYSFDIRRPSWIFQIALSLLPFRIGTRSTGHIPSERLYAWSQNQWNALGDAANVWSTLSPTVHIILSHGHT